MFKVRKAEKLMRESSTIKTEAAVEKEMEDLRGRKKERANVTRRESRHSRDRHRSRVDDSNKMVEEEEGAMKKKEADENRVDEDRTNRRIAEIRQRAQEVSSLSILN